ncbi:MAG: SDR family NAD(P)-dependent oxidoreductase [Alcaligenaceae bacterium]|nr:SDR family NAD(P)-dependent oxidoreductase [Alcaligenaceae bacterium]
MSDSQPVTIVTGGTFGLGQSITVDLARKGHFVVSFGLMQSQVSSTAQGFEALHRELAAAGVQGRVLVLEADVTKPGDVDLVVQKTLGQFGRIDCLVNNAAIGPLGTVLDTHPELFLRILEVNVQGAYLTSRAVLPHMIGNGGGAIVNVGSGAAYGKPNMAAYAASKGGLLALTMAMAYDHFHDHVRVNMVIPGGGGIVTGMSVGRFDGDVNKFVNRPITGTVAGRPMSGADFASAIGFLLSDDAATLSGTVLDVGCFAHQGGPVPKTNH